MYALPAIVLMMLGFAPAAERNLNLPPAAIVDFNQIVSDKVPTSINSWHKVTSTVTVPYPTQTV